MMKEAIPLVLIGYLVEPVSTRFRSSIFNCS